ncbi:hypothetical protein CVIRNUC_001842 [Coccomyxa viridis]|uniref:Uncharacterized protein n=1 Tax=Coccomyxa viridis TaxID=1274662 RepID=A0AAV1HVR4_9CHLO|nr:hypothetical protein CVIRNUC_001842 [Coccomyxa viridis]
MAFVYIARSKEDRLECTLYVRDAYVALERKLEELKQESTAHVVISKNEGVGKSWFALYMLVRLLGDKIAVMRHRQEFIFLVSFGAVHNLEELEARWSHVAHYPDDSKYKQYLKPPGHDRPLWMPFWEPHELEALQVKDFAEKVSSVELQQLIGRRGAVPRLVLDHAHQVRIDLRIQDAVGSLQEDDVRAFSPYADRISHRLARIHPPGWKQGDFVHYELTFVSTEIQLTVVQKIHNDMSQDMAALQRLTQSSYAQETRRTLSYFPQAAPAACRVCPGEGFRGPVDQSLLGPPQAAHSSPSEASATDSGSPQAPAVDCNSVHAMTGACSEAEDDSGDTALRPKGDNVARSTWMFMLPALPTQYISRAHSKEHVRTAEKSTTAIAESAKDGTAAEADAFGVGRQAMKDLVDRDVTLVEERVAACEMQFKMSIPPCVAYRAQFQVRAHSHGRPGSVILNG